MEKVTTQKRKRSISPLTITSTTSTAKDSTLTKSSDKVTEKPKEKRKNTFRAQGVNWLLTFPQCSMTKQEALTNITSKDDLKVKAVVVGQEKHTDGNLHLHIIVCLEERLQTRRADYWDFVCLKHGNYKVINSPKKAYAYVIKEDKDPTIYGTIPSVFLESKTSKSMECANLIQSGCSVREVVLKMPDYALLNLAKIVTFKSYYTNVCSTKSLESLVLPIKYEGMCMTTGSIVEWLNGNLFTTRQFKAKQLWIYGPPNTLKTSLLMRLACYCRIYTIPLQEDFYDSYDDSAYDLIVADEYKCQKTITFLNDFVQGGLPMNLRIKGGQTMKKKNLPVIICSNHSIADSYVKAHFVSVDALKSRFNEIEVRIALDLDGIQWESNCIPERSNTDSEKEKNEKDEASDDDIY